MDYKVLYRKYRPQNFDELVGQEPIKKILKNSIINNKIAHAYIFTGPRGTGKTSTAKIFAKTINCLNPKDGISCGECENCLNFTTSPDIIEMDAASNNGVENIRDIIENIGIAPTNSKYKIYIIDEVHMLSNQAWNAFLKTLEEPPSNVIFILATTDIQKVPITVLSRCQRFDFQRIDRKLIFDNLSTICEKENVKFTEDALNEISYLSDGCMRDALSILDQLSKVADEITLDVIKNNYGTATSEDIDTIYTALLHNDIDLLVEKLQFIKETGIDVKIFINKMLDNFIEKAVNMKKRNISNNAFRHIKKVIDSLNNLLGKININSNGYLLLELELIAFINDESNQISNREISQIISREIISDTDLYPKVENLIKNNGKNSIYNICDKFINIRINNSFAGANKDLKVKILEDWKKFVNQIVSENLNEFIPITHHVIPQVASETNILFVTNSESTKIVGNSKLYDIEIKYNTLYNTNYKMIFITKKEWEDVLKEFSANMKNNKQYEYISDEEYVSSEKNTVSLAEDIFGNEKINIE